MIQGRQKMKNGLYPFFWQHGEEHAILSEYMDKIAESGMKGVCIEARPHPDFVGDQWWSDLDLILAKAKECKGLTHREASVLLACPISEKIQEMYDLAAEIKKEFYGNRIVLFAPLYLSNYCVNGCVYCPYHKKNQHIARNKLTQE